MLTEFISHPPITSSVGSRRGNTSLRGRNTSPYSVYATFMVEDWVMDPSILADCSPFLVFQVSLFLLARRPPKMVEPLFPPKPTIRRPTLPEFFSVLNIYLCFKTFNFFECLSNSLNLCSYSAWTNSSCCNRPYDSISKLILLYFYNWRIGIFPKFIEILIRNMDFGGG